VWRESGSSYRVHVLRPEHAAQHQNHRYPLDAVSVYSGLSCVGYGQVFGASTSSINSELQPVFTAVLPILTPAIIAQVRSRSHMKDITITATTALARFEQTSTRGHLLSRLHKEEWKPTESRCCIRYYK